MPHIELIPPSPDHEVSVMNYRDEFLTAHPEHIPGAPSLAKSDSYATWLQLVEKDITNTDPARVKATQYIALSAAARLVGVIQLRHDLNEYLRNFGGHIGYSVRPSEQGKGYATEMLHLCLIEAHGLGLEKVLVTCDDDNIGSRRVIEKAGGVLENAVDNPTTGKQTLRFWVTLPPSDRLNRS